MTTKYKIKDVVSRSGFSAATLRYYEEIGLLPEADRTDAGSRLYDDHTLDRLAFIARAKQLGCNLDEIADLSLAWDGGECGPVQDRLRTLVSDKIAGAQQQIVELMTLTVELQRAAAALELHRPDGACDEHCGCVSEPPLTAHPKGVLLTTKPTNSSAVPIACTLGADSLTGRLSDWQALLTHIVRRDPIDHGVRVTLDPSTPHDELIRLAAAEQDCCQFFEFAITIDTRGIALEVRTPEDALPIVHSVFGTPA